MARTRTEDDPNKKTSKIPESDQSARKPQEEMDDEVLQGLGGEALAEAQTSNKSGKHSSVEKAAASRPHSAGEARKPVSGAYGSGEVRSGSETPGEHHQFRCNACGRFFDTEGALKQHEFQCRAAKQSTAEGRRELAEEDRKPHPIDDRGL